MQDSHHPITCKTSRKEWIDTARGLCMLSILLFHTEVYYTGEEIIPYACHVDNALLAFVFISGYLFANIPEKPFSVRHKILSVAKGIILPYFFFTTILAVPKAFFNDDMTIADILVRIMEGRASWFVAALAVAETLFALIVHFTKGRTTAMLMACALPYLVVAACHHYIPSEKLHAINYWCWQDALLMLVFLCFGNIYRQMETTIHHLHDTSAMLITAMLLAAIKWVVMDRGLYLTIEPITVSSFTLLLVDGLLGAILIIGICKRLPKMSLIQYTGRHSLLYYFFCGGVPMIVSLAFGKAGFAYQGHYLQVMLAFVAVYAAATVITWGILKLSSLYNSHHHYIF